MEGQLNEASQIRVRSSATLQVPVLRVLLQGQGRREQAHNQEAQELGGLRVGHLQEFLVRKWNGQILKLIEATARLARC